MRIRIATPFFARMRIIGREDTADENDDGQRISRVMT